MRKHLNVSYPLIVFFLFSCFISLSPSFDLIPWAVRYDEKRIIEIAILFLATCGITFSKDTNTTFLRIYFSLPKLARWSLIYILFAGLLSSTLSPSISHAFMELILFSLLFFFSLFTAAYFQEHKTTLISIILISIYISAFFYEITFFTSYVGSFLQSNPLIFPEPFSGFSSVRFFNQYQIWTIPFFSLAIFLYGRKLPPILLGLAYVIFISWWVLLFASESRGAMAALVFSSIITFIAFRGHAKPILVSQAYSAAVGLILYFLLFVYIPDSIQPFDAKNITSLTGRGPLWSNALRMISENPWLGVGPMHFAYYPNPNSFAHPHNSVIQLASEWGLPTAILIFCLYVWGNIAWINKFNSQKSSIQNNPIKNQLWVTLFYSFTAGSLYSLVSGVIVMPLSQILLVVVLGIMLGMYFQPQIDSQTTSRNRIISSIATASILLMSIFEYGSPIRDKLEINPYSYQQPALILGPRFWQNGGIPRSVTTKSNTDIGMERPTIQP